MFCPDQIICIELDDLRLFAEVIQMILARNSTEQAPNGNRIWARPLALAKQEIFDIHLLHDLRTAPQLILPSAIFREAYDTEVIPLMSELFRQESEFKLEPDTDLIGRRALHAFVNSLWPRPITS